MDTRFYTSYVISLLTLEIPAVGIDTLIVDSLHLLVLREVLLVESSQVLVFVPSLLDIIAAVY